LRLGTIGRHFTIHVMIYWSSQQLPEVAHLSVAQRREVWLNFVCTRQLSPEWHDRVLGAVIIVATAAGFGVGLFSFSPATAIVTLACGLAGTFIGLLPLFVLHLQFINSRSVRHDLKRFISHPDPFIAALGCFTSAQTQPDRLP